MGAASSSSEPGGVIADNSSNDLPETGAFDFFIVGQEFVAPPQGGLARK